MSTYAAKTEATAILLSIVEEFEWSVLKENKDGEVKVVISLVEEKKREERTRSAV
jgi:hypothetical protein